MVRELLYVTAELTAAAGSYNKWLTDSVGNITADGKGAHDLAAIISQSELTSPIIELALSQAIFFALDQGLDDAFVILVSTATRVNNATAESVIANGIKEVCL